MSPEAEVVVIGAGPVGLTTALALATKGRRVLVVEQRESLDDRLRASTFHPPTLDMLGTLGVANQLVDRGLRVPIYHVRQFETDERAVFDLSLIAHRTDFPFRLQCEQAELCRILCSKLQREPKLSALCEIRFGWRFSSCRQSSTSVTVQLERDREPERRVDCHYLVGADGGSSAVRASVDIGFAGETYDHASLLVTTDFPFDEHIDELAPVTYFWSRRGPFALLQLPDCWRASLYPRAGDDLESISDAKTIQSELARIAGTTHSSHSSGFNVLAKNPYRVHARCAETFRRQRVLLAGDAAHLNPPNGGMGMNGGIHDAMLLGSTLDRVLDGASDELLDDYDSKRRSLASRAIIPQAKANRRRMSTRSPHEQQQRLRELQEIASDSKRCAAFLLRSSMIEGLDSITCNAREPL